MEPPGERGPRTIPWREARPPRAALAPLCPASVGCCNLQQDDGARGRTPTRERRDHERASVARRLRSERRGSSPDAPASITKKRRLKRYAMAPDKRVSIRVIAPLRETVPERLTVLVLMDGNGRWNKQRIDYGAGERKLLEVTRHLAADDRVGAVVACVASSDNVAKRSPQFFRALRAALLEFGAAIEGGELPGVRVEVAGDLSRLRLMGEEAASCADG